ncbi:hypothetical protein MCP1_100017 [Candidatus Terasakiella magnetica]|nr:hypothetical protein MCP1_100017 [Candidatus Terasakiella magnetica]
MSDLTIVRLGWYPPVRSALFAAFFAAVGYTASRPDPASAEPEWALLWLGTGTAIIFMLMLMHSLWLILSGRPILTLSAQGLQARTCDDALIPWDLVTSVTRGAKKVSLLSSSVAALMLESISRHDAFEIVLDSKVTDLGVKHSENLTNIGFQLVPLKLSLSSQELADTFARYLPPERCINFDESSTPKDRNEIAGRAAMAAMAVAIGTAERMETESPNDSEPTQTIPET